MPKYVWRCQRCLLTTEVERKVAEYDQPPEACATINCKCDPQKDMHRTVVTANFQLKGTGWFRDGY